MAKIAIMGAGAVGCYYGALLAQAGHDVVLIGRPSLGEAIAAEGLRLETSAGIRLSHPRFASQGAAVAGADLILVCVKSPDSAQAAQQMAGHIAPKAIVLSLQNGLSNAAHLQRLLNHEVIPAVVYAAVEMAAAGHVRHKGGGQLILGPSAEGAAEILSAAGIKTEVSAKVQEALWSKLVINCTVNAVSALSQSPYGLLGQDPEALALMRGLMQEALAVAKAEGIALSDDFWPNIQAIIAAMPEQYSSMAQDLARGRASEIAQINGEIVTHAKAYGLAVPLNSAMLSLVRLAARTRG